jgi:hypothetical protein
MGFASSLLPPFWATRSAIPIVSRTSSDASRKSFEGRAEPQQVTVHLEATISKFAYFGKGGGVGPLRLRCRRTIETNESSAGGFAP